MEKKLTLLVEKTRAALGDRLVSVILYGSGASGEHHANFSDLNVLCVLSRITVQELADAEPVVKWWRGEGNPSPLLLSREEVHSSTDVFAIEFHDMLEQRRVLWGEDAIAGVNIDRTFYRAQVEHDLLSKLLRLRQKAAATLGDNKALLALMLDSVSTFCVLLRHAMLLAGHAPGVKKREIVAHLAEIGVDAAPFGKLLDVRERRASEKDVAPRALFEQYLAAIDSAVKFVDRLEK
jgi:predicted nucleotidyltransferase